MSSQSVCLPTGPTAFCVLKAAKFITTKKPLGQHQGGTPRSHSLFLLREGGACSKSLGCRVQRLQDEEGLTNFVQRLGGAKFKVIGLKGSETLK